jgi:hypothetical protein
LCLQMNLFSYSTGPDDAEGRVAPAPVVDSLDPIADSELSRRAGGPQVAVGEPDFVVVQNDSAPALFQHAPVRATDRVKLCSSANRANCVLVYWQPRLACRVTHRASPRPSQPEVTRSVRMFVNGPANHPPRAAISDPHTDTASIPRYADRCSGASRASRWPRLDTLDAKTGIPHQC